MGNPACTWGLASEKMSDVKVLLKAGLMAARRVFSQAAMKVEMTVFSMADLWGGTRVVLSVAQKESLRVGLTDEKQASR